MRRVASFLARLLIGLAATVFLVAALLFMLGLHLALVASRSRKHRGLVLMVEIAERAAELALLAKSGAEDVPPSAGEESPPPPPPAAAAPVVPGAE